MHYIQEMKLLPIALLCLTTAVCCLSTRRLFKKTLKRWNIEILSAQDRK